VCGEDGAAVAESFGEGVGDGSAYGVGAGGLGKDDGAAAESAAGHSRAEYAVAAACLGDDGIQFFAAYLVVVPQGGVGGVHQPAEAVVVAGFQCTDGFQRPLDFSNDVAGPHELFFA